MRFYRNHYHTDGGSSGGYVWFTTKREAVIDAKEKAPDYSGGDAEFYSGGDAELNKTDPVAEVFDLDMRNKKTICAVLNSVAEHPDNG